MPRPWLVLDVDCSTPSVITMHTPQKACHNCRRARLKCDQTFPHCAKCSTRQQACLGYQRLFRWDQGIASRGKLAGMTFEMLIRQNAPSRDLLLDPLQDMDRGSRKYLFHFSSDVCKDLVLYDVPGFNPFRELLPMACHYPLLKQVMIANAAMHMSNSCQKFLNTANVANDPNAPLMAKYYRDALFAKQRALRLLKLTLEATTLASPDAEIDVILAVVVLLIEFEILDFDHGSWAYHIEGAKAIIASLYKPELLKHADMTPLRRCLTSNCIVFDIMGSTMAHSGSKNMTRSFSDGALLLLQDAEGNHCSSFPSLLLELMQAGIRLLKWHDSCHEYTSDSAKKQQASQILHAAQRFDPQCWARDLESRSPKTDFMQRLHVAHAHRAAVEIYLSHVLLSVCNTAKIQYDLECLVAQISDHLSLITSAEPLFTATAWPTFIAGIETRSLEKQKWVTGRFEELWRAEPWGLLKGAMHVLNRVWATRHNGKSENEDGKSLSALGKSEERLKWIDYLKDERIQWLIL